MKLDTSCLLWKPLYRTEEAEKVVVGIPFRNSAPNRLRRLFSERFWTYDLERGADLFDEKIVDLGNVVASTDFQKTMQKTGAVIEKVLRENPKARFVFLGGDHRVTLMTAAALRPRTLLSLDAHPDLCDEYEGNRFSNACVMRRVSELGARVSLRGVRTASQEEHAALKKTDWAKPLNFKGSVDYLSIDADVLDPSFAEVENPEAMGASVQEVIQQIRRTNFKHCDLVEWVPDRGYAAVAAVLKEVLWK